VALVLALVAAAVPAAAAGGSARNAANAAVYPDSTGEDALAPDITSTAVSNDDGGLLTFRVAIANRPALTPDMEVLLFLDADRDAATGDAQSPVVGADYALVLVPGEVDLFKWQGGNYVPAEAPSLAYSYASTGPTIKLKTSELGTTRAFDFAVIAKSGVTFDAAGGRVYAHTHQDTSPDAGHGPFTYEVRITVRLSLVAFATAPKPVRAGKPFSVGLAADASDTADAVIKGDIVCKARLAGSGLAVKEKQIVSGIAVCIWSVPKTARRKRLAGSVTLSARGGSITRSFSLTVS
jgi:hypothetical protein